MTATLIASWLLTYLLHSTVLLCAALVVSRSMNGRNLAVQEILLRAALVGGILTATLQIGLGISPLAGVVAFDTTVQPQAAAPIASLQIPAADSSLGANAAPGMGIALDWAAALIALWGLGSILALLGVLRSVVDLKRLLRTRCFQPAGRLVENLATAMGLHKRVKLSTSKAIAVPFATGIRQPEICCPERVEELAREHRTSLFAHELAHLARRDPTWQLFYRLGEAILVLQPLNRLVRRRLEEIAEHLTDERAVACTGDRLGLARCLVVVAHWGISSRIGLPATALAAGPRLDRRVKRLISGATDHSLGTRWALPVIISVLVGAVTILPAIGTIPAHAESTDSHVVSTTAWSTMDDRPAPAPPAPVPPTPIEADLAVPAPDSPAPLAAPQAAAAPRPAAVPRAPVHPEPTLPEEPTQPEELTQPDETIRPEEPALPEEPRTPAEKAAEEHRARAEAQARSRQRASEERAREHAVRAEERARDRQRATEERAREHAVRAEERARDRQRATEERALAHAKRAEEVSRLSEAQRRELQRRARELSAEARKVNSEEAQAVRERAQALTAEARTLEREATSRKVQLTEEQRQELRHQAAELRVLAEAQNREFAREARERARSLSEQARRLAEESEAERRRLEELEK